MHRVELSPFNGLPRTAKLPVDGKRSPCLRVREEPHVDRWGDKVQYARRRKLPDGGAKAISLEP
ncbi:MAG: hypothetical protein ABI877_02895, partial [Gemmatimonadaceae bacterium]